MQKIQARVTPNTDTFHAVFFALYGISYRSQLKFPISDSSYNSPFPIAFTVILHMIQIDIASNPMRYTYPSFYLFASRIAKDLPTTERPKNCHMEKKVLCDIRALEMLETVKSRFH